MKLRIIEGQEAIDEVATAAMFATLTALTKEGAISAETADQFCRTHVCVALNQNMFKRFWSRMFPNEAPLESESMRLTVMEAKS